MNKRILIIEDDEFLGDVLLQKLKNENYEVILSRDGAEGFDKLKDFKPDLLLLDIVLPHMNGYEILEAKQRYEDIKNIPVIVISNSGQPVEINRILSLGVKDYLVKADFDPDDVLVKVKKELSKSSSNDAIDIKKDLELASDGDRIKLKGRKILWVEDDAFLSEIISRKLANQECSLAHAQDGESAIIMLDKEIPDIIMLDILLPGIDGFEVLRRIKLNDKWKNIPVILISNLGQKSDIDKGKELGAVKFLVKATVNMDEIIDEIVEVLQESSN